MLREPKEEATDESETTATIAAGTGSTSEAVRQAVAEHAAGFVFRSPTAQDGQRVWKLIEACPPLDTNSLYCNVLQCTEFNDTCILAERNGELVGWVSGCRFAKDPDTLFVWQIAVHPKARGLGLAKAMIRTLLDRPCCADVTQIKTTITPDNEASWAVFSGTAEELNAPVRRRTWFRSDLHFSGRQDSENLVTVGPFDPPGAD